MSPPFLRFYPSLARDNFNGGYNYWHYQSMRNGNR